MAKTNLFRWDNNSDATNASPLDETLLIVFNTTKSQAVYATGLSNRAVCNQSVTMHDSFFGDMAQCYIAFFSFDGKKLFDSIFAGEFLVL